MESSKFIIILVILLVPLFDLTTNGYSHRHPGFAQRLQIKPGCLQVPQRYTEAPSPTPTIIFSSLEEVSGAEAD
ncbi:uncharacterized protein LOC108022638 [Drosophila biarmipes]|uniref:uncharacterized protein LOC108022638 n=1 Tax=Drosophila biarmipes TaxID=125945 RepID=UPI0007E840B3|nr:uncharacterized protein LOC108022638 [Drosophila biarmipes]